MSILARKLPIIYALLLAMTLSYSVNAAVPPVLNFSDIISGPSTGLGDGKGSGVIVTIWGQNLGSSQGASTLTFIDSEGKEKPVAHIYYWKNADGQLPSGPANLFESHKMQEIAFSIPQSANGEGTIKITVNDNDARLPFTVRDGNIYHVKSTGNDSTGQGSYNNPYLTIEKADGAGASSGDTLYIHDVITGSEDTNMAIYNNNGDADSTLAAQFSYIAYPGTRPEAIGARTFNNYFGKKGIDGLVLSKFSLFAADMDTDEYDLPVNRRHPQTEAIVGSKDGRAVGNFITDEHPNDISGACPDAQGAAIVGTAQGRNQVENFKVFGNHIKDYGCTGTNRQHHTTYFTIRSGDKNLQLESPEIAYNYLQDNMASGGLHYFDENHAGLECGNFTTPFKIHNNVVVNQVGPAIANYAKCPTSTTFEYYNNVAINSGLYPPNNNLLENTTKRLALFQAVHIGQSHEASTATLNFFNNTIIGWNVNDQTGVIDACIGFGANTGTLTINWNNNICLTDKDKPFILSDYQGKFLEARISGKNNLWFSSANTNIAPSWDTNPLLIDPLFTIKLPLINVNKDSPIKTQETPKIKYDIYGILRTGNNTVGAVTISDKKALPIPPPAFKATQKLN